MQLSTTVIRVETHHISKSIKQQKNIKNKKKKLTQEKYMKKIMTTKYGRL